MVSLAIGELFEVEKGTLQSSKNVEGKFTFITAGEDWKTHISYTHDCEALVFAMGASGSLGRTHYIGGKFIASDLCFILTPLELYRNKIDLKFYHNLFSYLRSDIVRNTATGTSKLAINITNFKNYRIPYFDISLQLKLRAFLENIKRNNGKLNLALENQTKLIAQLRQAILKEVVQGKLVPQDPTAEPASELLKRIKAEKDRLIREKKIKKEKPLPPISEDEIPYELPEGWAWVRLGEVCDQITDGTHHTPNYVSKGVPFLSVKDITNGFIDFSNTKFISEEEHKKLIKRCKPEYEDILFTKVGTTGIAKVIDVQREFSIFVSLALIKFSKTEIFPKSLEYLLNSPFVKQQSQKFTMGIGNKNLVLKHITNFLIPLPPLKEQKRIVAKVDELMKLCDQLEEQLKQSKEESERLMQAVLQEAFEGKYSEVNREGSVV